MLVIELPEDFTDDLADGGMGEDDLTGIVDTKLHFQHLGCAPDHFACIGTDQVDTQDGALFLVHKYIIDSFFTS